MKGFEILKRRDYEKIFNERMVLQPEDRYIEFQVLSSDYCFLLTLPGEYHLVLTLALFYPPVYLINGKWEILNVFI